MMTIENSVVATIVWLGYWQLHDGMIDNFNARCMITYCPIAELV